MPSENILYGQPNQKNLKSWAILNPKLIEENMMGTTKIKLLSGAAEIPTRAHESDTGYDLKMIDVKTIKGDTIYFNTGISVQPPEGKYFEIVPRSSLSKLPLSLANSVGIVDEHYRGEILVAIRVLHSRLGEDLGRSAFPGGVVNIFGRKPASLYDVAQLILREKPVLTQLILRDRLSCDFEEVSELEMTERGKGGFGSTDSVQTITKASKRKGLIKRSDQ